MGMTFASIPALLDEWSPYILKAAYDDRPIYAKEKAGVTVGMAMTEKQGGSNLRAKIIAARPATARRGSGAPYLLTGHEWFFSVPMSNVLLTLARTEKGLSCFVATCPLRNASRRRLGPGLRHAAERARHAGHRRPRGCPGSLIDAVGPEKADGSAAGGWDRRA